MPKFRAKVDVTIVRVDIYEVEARNEEQAHERLNKFLDGETDFAVRLLEKGEPTVTGDDEIYEINAEK